MIQVVSHQHMKLTNMKRVVELIRLNKHISRAAIAKMTKLSPATVSSIVDELMLKGIVVERLPMENKRVGRKAISLEINNVQKYIIGMEISYDSAKGTAFNLKNEPIVTIREPFHWRNDPGDEIIEAASQIITGLMHAVRDRYDELTGIGIGIQGVLDADKRTIVTSTVLNVSNLELHRLLRQKFDLPIFIEEETLMAATAEKELFEKGAGPFIYLSINNGLGASVIMNDQSLQGASGDIMEIGHMSLDMNGEPCPCGNRGCFELHVSTVALENKTALALAEHADSVLHPLRTRSMRIEEALVEAMQQHDRCAAQVVDELAAVLGNGIVNLIHIFNPQTIVIGGRISTLGLRLQEGVRRQVEQRAIKSLADRCTIELARQKDDAVTRGVAVYVLNKVLEMHIG